MQKNHIRKHYAPESTRSPKGVYPEKPIHHFAEGTGVAANGPNSPSVTHIVSRKMA
jgi:hypothetical protein